MQPIVDLYPIVVELDDTALDHDGDTSTHDLSHPARNRSSLYNTVASEASLFASERSWMIDENSRITETKKTDAREVGLSPGKKLESRFFLHNPKSPCRHRTFGPSHRHDCDEKWKGTKQQMHADDTNGNLNHGDSSDRESTPSGGFFSNLRCFISGYRRRRNSNFNSKTTSTLSGSIETDHQRYATDRSSISSIVSVPSLARVGTKRNRPRLFHDDYVLTQQIVDCRVSTLWECVHRPTGRRYCAKAIDKRRFTSQSEREMAVKELAMQHLIRQQSPPAACLPRIHDIFADEEALGATQQQQQNYHDESSNKSGASVCSGSTVSVNSYSGCDDSNHSNYWYIIQDFEGGRNLAIYLQDRENDTFDMSMNNADCIGGDEIYCRSSGSSRAASKIMQESEVRPLARALLLALKELHRRSICHNNLCPENILLAVSTTNRRRSTEREVNESNDGRRNQSLDQRGPESYHHIRHWRKQSHYISPSENFWQSLKLCDLGCAFVVNDATDVVDGDEIEDLITNGDTKKQRTPRHSSLYYTSPEVVLGNSPGLASDVWSLGVILYRCFAGVLPFQEQSEDTSRRAYSRGPESSFSSTELKSCKLQDQLKKDICRANFYFGRLNKRNTDRRWSRVSRTAKQFLSALLNPDPSERLTCEEALLHPWFKNGVVAAQSLTSTSSLSIPFVPSLASKKDNHHHPESLAIETGAANETAKREPDCESVQYPENARPDLNSVDTAISKPLLRRLFGRFRSNNNDEIVHNVTNTDEDVAS
eukprot:CAMPEP_0197174002 /NCGR_PEP_ID=MMETSP1423-20130617/717_1 /TAXON_ID=476441 /ORGANISM="Pseudo-nitzschia heimii, Strain UNC1101" /LENGTH=765 /DNA_ID=CAMNT_0042622891 /DNA_START=342 /DNA_END=2635 /DNA_ORIENTATION=-